MPISDYQTAALKDTRHDPPEKKNRRRISTLMILAGLVVIASPFVTEIYGYFVKERLNQEWDKQIAKQKKLARTAQQGQIARLGQRTVDSEDNLLEKTAEPIRDLTGGEFPMTKIKIPKIGLEQVVSKGVGVEVLKNGPGHYTGTAVPGQRGNVAIAGHRVTYTHPFNRIDELDNGDKIILETADNIYEYRVRSSQQLEPDDLSALQPTDDARLTLTTCTPKYSARYRLDVQASLEKITSTRPLSFLRRLVKKLAKPAPINVPTNILELAVQRSRERLVQNPQDVSAMIDLSIIYRSTGENEKAVEQLGKALEIDPDREEIYYELSVIYQKAGRVKEAINELKKAIERAPGFEYAHYRLGMLYLENNQAERAKQAFIAALTINPLSADTHFFLGQAYEKQKDNESALREYKEALRFVPDFLEAEVSFKKLKKIQRARQ
ncbi:MAG TPA: sortase [Actinobacteria bacterium]|nr:sortase [Actinomycetota bacterium]